MSVNVQKALEEAYGHIEAQQLAEARRVLGAVLANEKNSVDAWWLYAHAVEDPQQAISALEKVIQLDPTHEDAKQLLQTARQQAVSASSDDEFDIDLDDEFASSDEEPRPEDSRRRTLVILGSIIGLVLIGAIILIASPRGEQPETTVTEPPLVAQGAGTNTPISDVSIETEAVVPTDLVVSTPVTVDIPTNTPMPFATATPQPIITPDEPIITVPSIESFVEALAENYPVSGESETIQTELGETLLVTMCTARGENHQRLVPEAMQGLSRYIELLPATSLAVGVRFNDCDLNETINVMVMPRESALSYFNADLSEQDFRRSWRVIDA